MTSSDAMLARLADRLRDPSPEGRAELLVTLADLFEHTAARARPGPAADTRRAAFGEIIASLARPAPEAARAALADRLADMEAAPPGLMGDLARDLPDIAGPVLRRWSGFSEDDLAGFAERLPVSHLHHLAARDGLPVRAGNTMLRRCDLPVRLVLDLPWLLPPGLGRGAVARALELDMEDAEAALCADMEEGTAAPDTVPPDDASASFIASKIARGELGEALAVRLLRDGDMARFVACLAGLTGLAMATAARAASDPGGHAFAVMACGMGLSRSCFAALAGLLSPGRSTSTTFALMQRFETLHPDHAARLTALWQLRFAGPEAPDLPHTAHNAPRRAAGRR